jgi:predicted ATPase
MAGMRVAVSGTHRTGKTTLVEALGELLPSYEVVEEPYHQLVEEGHEFAEMPSLEDFELQLRRSIDCLGEGGDQLFDRCPADLLAYLVTHEDADAFDLDAWLSRARVAMRQLDLVVYVPIEQPDRVVVPSAERALRRRVDEALREGLVDDRWEFGVEVLEVEGSTAERLRQVQARLQAGR